MSCSSSETVLFTQIWFWFFVYLQQNSFRNVAGSADSNANKVWGLNKREFAKNKSKTIKLRLWNGKTKQKQKLTISIETFITDLLKIADRTVAVFQTKAKTALIRLRNRKL